MKPVKSIILFGLAVGIILITTSMFMYFYKLDTNVTRNTKQVEYSIDNIRLLQQNDSLFLVIFKESRDHDSVRLELLKENHELLIYIKTHTK